MNILEKIGKTEQVDSVVSWKVFLDRDEIETIYEALEYHVKYGSSGRLKPLDFIRKLLELANNFEKMLAD